jgi:hypothetical protein
MIMLRMRSARWVNTNSISFALDAQKEDATGLAIEKDSWIGLALDAVFNGAKACR